MQVGRRRETVNEVKMEIIGYRVAGSGYFGAELARIMNTKPGAVIRAVYDPENGEAAVNSIAAADACTRSLNENRKVRLGEVIDGKGEHS